MNTEESAGSRGQGRSLAEFPGLGLVALDPRHNTTLHVDGDNIYAATGNANAKKRRQLFNYIY